MGVCVQGDSVSVLLIGFAFKTKLPPTAKLVLLGLCDSAADSGECFPSVESLAEKCSSGERTVQEALRFLEQAGYVTRHFRNGRSTLYSVKQPCEWPQTPAPAAPPGVRQPHPAAAAPRSSRTPPPQQPHPRGAPTAPGGAPAAPITVTYPSINRQGNRKTPPTHVGVPELVAAGFTDSQAEDFIAHKLAKKAPLTARAWADHKAEAAKAGWSPVDAAEKVMARGWKGFDASYVAGEKPASRHSALEARNAATVAKLQELIR